MKDLCIPLWNPDEWASPRCYTARWFESVPYVQPYAQMAIAHRAEMHRFFSRAPAAALQLAVSFQARGRMTSFGGENLLHLEITFCVQSPGE